MEVFNLNIIPGAVAPIIHASQYDEDREFRANLFEGDQVFELTGAETINVNVRKPDGNVVTAAVVNTGSNYVEFSTTLQMTACAGANLCQLRIEDSPRKIGTLNFILAVERDPLEGGIQSASEIDNLETQVAGMVALEVANQYDSANVIFDNTPTAGHGVGYAVTSEGVKTELDTLSTAIAGKVDQANFDATNLPIQSGSATNTKDYIDSKFTYSTTEKVVGKWIDNRPIYEKTISLGQLPNNSQTQIAHNITDLARIISYEGGAYDGNTETNMPLPYTGTNFVAVAVITTNIFVTTNSDRSNLVGYLTLRYVKSTD